MKYEELTPFTKSFIEVTSIIILVSVGVFGALMFFAGLFLLELGMVAMGSVPLLIVGAIFKAIRK